MECARTGNEISWFLRPRVSDIFVSSIVYSVCTRYGTNDNVRLGIDISGAFKRHFAKLRT